MRLSFAGVAAEADHAEAEGAVVEVDHFVAAAAHVVAVSVDALEAACLAGAAAKSDSFVQQATDDSFRFRSFLFVSVARTFFLRCGERTNQKHCQAYFRF